MLKLNLTEALNSQNANLNLNIFKSGENIQVQINTSTNDTEGTRTNSSVSETYKFTGTPQEVADDIELTLGLGVLVEV